MFVSGSCPVLVERDHELAILSEAAFKSSEAGPRMVVISGEAGSGKSRLTSEFVESLPEDWGVEFWSAARSVDELVDYLKYAKPQRPLCLVLEDVANLEPAAIRAVSEALRELKGSAVLLLATFRLGSHAIGHPVSRAIADLLRQPKAFELRLSSLSMNGVAQMIRAMRQDDLADDSDFVARVYERSGGIPFFVEEIVRHPTSDVPWTAAEAVVSRMAPLGSSARKAAELLAASRESVSVELINNTVADGDEALAELRDAGLIVDIENRVRLRHALVGEALYESLAEKDRRLLHRTLAVELEKMSDAPPDALVRHWAGAGEMDRAANWGAVAGERFSQQGAFGAAAQCFEVALAVLPKEHSDRGGLLEKAAIAAAYSGRISDASKWAHEADREYHEAGEAWKAASLWLNPGLAYIPKPKLFADFQAHSPLDLIHQAGVDAAEGRVDEAVATIRAVLERDPSEAGWEVRGQGASSLWSLGRPDEAFDIMEELLAEQKSAQDWAFAARTLGTMGRLVQSLGFHEQGIAHAREALECAKKAPGAVIWPQGQASLALALAKIGELDEAEQLIEELPELESPLMEYAQLPVAIIELERGQLPSSRQRVESLLPVIRATRTQVLLLPALLVRARLDLLQGDAAAAIQNLAEMDEVDVGSVLHLDHSLRLLVAGLAHEALGHGEMLADSVTAAHDLARTSSGPGVTATADFLSGIRDRFTGDLRGALTRFESAARTWERAPNHVHAAEAWLNSAQVAVALGDRERASAHLARATEIVEPRGYLRIASEIGRAQASLSAAGPALPKEFARLTPREIDVVRLVAAGRTNKEIAAALYISEKTARNRLSDTFAKLGMSRRAEVAALAARTGLISDQDENRDI